MHANSSNGNRANNAHQQQLFPIEILEIILSYSIDTPRHCAQMERVNKHFYGAVNYVTVVASTATATAVTSESHQSHVQNNNNNNSSCFSFMRNCWCNVLFRYQIPIITNVKREFESQTERYNKRINSTSNNNNAVKEKARQQQQQLRLEFDEQLVKQATIVQQQQQQEYQKQSKKQQASVLVQQIVKKIVRNALHGFYQVSIQEINEYLQQFGPLQQTVVVPLTPEQQVMKSNHQHVEDQKQSNTGPSKLQIAVLGEVAVGKSTLVMQYIHDRFIADYDPTIEDEHKVVMSIKGGSSQCNVYILDTAGSECYALRSEYYVRTLIL